MLGGDRWSAFARTSGSVVTSIQSFEASGLSMVMQSPVFERQQVENLSLAFFVSIKKSEFYSYSIACTFSSSIFSRSTQVYPVSTRASFPISRTVLAAATTVAYPIPKGF